MLHKLVFLALAFPALGACTSAPASAAPPSSEQVSLIDSTCAQVMGLRRGEYYYAECQESLGKSLAGKVESEMTLRSYDDCRKQGLAPDSPALSACVLGRSNASEAQARMAAATTSAPLVYPADELQSGRSYYNVTPTVQWHREQYSCAQLGFIPGSRAFAQCSADLMASLLPGLE